MKYATADNAYGRISAAITTTSQTITLSSSQNLPASNWIGTLVQYAQDGTPAKFEKVLVTNNASNTLTVTRGYDGTPAQTFNAGDYVFLNVTSAVVRDMQDEVTRLWTAKAELAHTHTIAQVDSLSDALAAKARLNGGNALSWLQTLNDDLTLFGKFTKKIVTNIGSQDFTIASRWRNSGIAHLSGGHITQILWGNSVATPEWSGDDGGYGIEFWSHANPYLSMIVKDVNIWRSDGDVTIKGKKVTTTWTDSPPTVSGTSGTVGTYGYRKGRYLDLPLMNCYIYEFDVKVTDKGTLAGQVNIDLPINAAGYVSEMIQTGGVYTPGTITTKALPIIYNGNKMYFAIGIDTGALQWSGVANGDIIRGSALITKS